MFERVSNPSELEVCLIRVVVRKGAKMDAKSAAEYIEAEMDDKDNANPNVSITVADTVPATTKDVEDYNRWQTAQEICADDEEDDDDFGDDDEEDADWDEDDPDDDD